MSGKVGCFQVSKSQLTALIQHAGIRIVSSLSLWLSLASNLDKVLFHSSTEVGRIIKSLILRQIEPNELVLGEVSWMYKGIASSCGQLIL